MTATDPAGDDDPVIVVPEVRDYTKINAELTRLLDAGHRRVRLAGVDGQRLLARGLRGDWSAEVIVEGNAGPELAADLIAPNGVCLLANHFFFAADADSRASRRIHRAFAACPRFRVISEHRRPFYLATMLARMPVLAAG